MKIDIRDIRSDKLGFNQIAKLAKDTSELFLNDVELDFSSCSFFEANMAAPFYVLIRSLFEAINNVVLINLSIKTKNILRKNHFLKLFGEDSLVDTKQTTIPFRIFKLNSEQHFNDYLGNYMRGRGIPTMSSALTKKFLQSLLEIFTNASIHSDSQWGIFACGQFFPTKKRMDFTIVDAGIGFVGNVRRFTQRHDMSSSEAISWALDEGRSTKEQGYPGGLGLKLIKDFICLNKGKLQIVSRFGYCEIANGKLDVSEMKYDFPGTCVNIEINTEDTSSYCLKSELKSDDIF